MRDWRPFNDQWHSRGGGNVNAPAGVLVALGLFRLCVVPVARTGTCAFIVEKVSSVTDRLTESWHESTPSHPPKKQFQSV